MTEIVGSRNFIQQEEVAFSSGVSEGTLTRMGAANNYLMRRTFYKEDFAFNGYFNANTFDNGVSGIRFVEKESQIISYYMSIRSGGSSGNNAFNIGVYDESGSFITNLFGSGSNRILISADSQSNVIVGKKNLDTTPENIEVNTGSTTTVQYGTLNISTIPAGYMLIPFVDSNGTNARNLFFSMRLGEL